VTSWPRNRIRNDLLARVGACVLHPDGGLVLGEAMKNPTLRRCRDKTLKLVRVTWIDAADYNGWVHSVDNLEPSKIESIGWLVKSRKRYIVIASAVSAYGSMNAPLCIPRSAITEYRTLNQ